MKKLQITLCLFVALTGAITSVHAQSDTSKHHWFLGGKAGAVQLQATYRQSDLNGLNTILNKSGISSLPDNNFWLNLSMNHIHGKWLFEDGLGSTFTSTSAANPTNGIKAQYTQFQIFTRAAYNVSKNENFRLFPFVGLNFSDAMLHIKDDNRIKSTSDFSTELTNLSASKTLWNPNIGFEFGAGFDYLIKLKSKKMDYYTVERNIPIGFRLGYYLQATNSNWKVEDNYTVNNGPTNKQSAIFVSFNIGLGYSIKH